MIILLNSRLLVAIATGSFILASLLSQKLKVKSAPPVRRKPPQ